VVAKGRALHVEARSLPDRLLDVHLLMAFLHVWRADYMSGGLNSGQNRADAAIRTVAVI
jgi:hypothetical protein